MDRELSDVVLMDEIEVDKLIVDAEFWRNECVKLNKRVEFLEKNVSKLSRTLMDNVKKQTHSKVS